MNGMNQDKPDVLLPPPVLYGLCLALGFLLKALINPPLMMIWKVWPIGAALLAASIGLALWAVLTFTAHGTSVDPSHPVTALVQTGPYRFSRNPIYVALTIAVVGVAIINQNIWLIPLLVLVHIVLHYGVIRREEQYLTNKFGAAYCDYQQRVRRWL